MKLFPKFLAFVSVTLALAVSVEAAHRGGFHMFAKTKRAEQATVANRSTKPKGLFAAFKKKEEEEKPEPRTPATSRPAPQSQALVSTTRIRRTASPPKKGLFNVLFGNSENRNSLGREDERLQPAPARPAVRENRFAKTQPRTNQRASRERGNGLLAALFGGKPKRSQRVATRYVQSEPAQLPADFNYNVLSQSNRSNSRVVIDISDQRAYLLVNERIAVDSPVSTARPGKYTPRGTFNMTERIRSGKISTLYHVAMPYWMRLDGTAYGVHAGYLPGYPASAGCIRLPSDAAQVIFDNTQRGTSVSIHDSWPGH